eukprot:3287241-Prymnesium_polylepis.2
MNKSGSRHHFEVRLDCPTQCHGLARWTTQWKTQREARCKPVSTRIVPRANLWTVAARRFAPWGCAVSARWVVALRRVRVTLYHDERMDRLDALSCALVTAAASASMLESTGTRSIEPCAFSMLVTHAAVTHRTCRTK